MNITRNIYMLLLIVCAGLVSCTDKSGEMEEAYSIQFTENPIVVGFTEDVYTSAIISDYKWVAESQDSWITDVSNHSGELEFRVQTNTEKTSRDGKIVFSIPQSSYTKALTVRQLANTGGLSIEKTEVSLGTVGEEVDLDVISDENWSVVSISNDWLCAQKKNSSVLTLTAGPNYTGTALSAEVKIATVNENIIVYVSQDADNSVYFGADTEMGRRFVHRSGLAMQVIEDKSYSLDENVNVLEIQYFGGNSPYSLYLFEVHLEGNVSLAVTCPDDDDSSIKRTDAELTEKQIVRKQLAAMQNNRTSIDVLGGVNGDFFYGGVGASGVEARNNLLHGVVHRRGVCLKDTFDGGDACTVFAVMKNGKAMILDQKQYVREKDNIAEALGGRQRLLSAGAPLEFTDKRSEPRTAVGVSADGKKVIISIMDGRRDSYSVGATYDILSRIMLSMGAADAINLDGGGSSTFVVRETSDFKTKNRPTDSAGEREVVTGLAITINK